MCLKLKTVEFQWGNVFNVHSNRMYVIHMERGLHVLHLVRIVHGGNPSMCLHRLWEGADSSQFIGGVSGLLCWRGVFSFTLLCSACWALTLQDCKLCVPVRPSLMLCQSTGEDNQCLECSLSDETSPFWH